MKNINILKCIKKFFHCGNAMEVFTRQEQIWTTDWILFSCIYSLADEWSYLKSLTPDSMFEA